MNNKWIVQLGDDFLKDLLFGLKIFKKARGLASIIILTLAIGIGTTTTIFSVFKGVLLSPLPYENSKRLVSLSLSFPNSGFSSIPRYLFDELKKESGSFDGLYGEAFWPGVMSELDTPIRFYGHQVSEDMLSTLGLSTYIGRDFGKDDFIPGNDNVVILSYRLWNSHFQGNRDILNKFVNIDEKSYSVIGVMPPEYLSRPIIDPTVFSPSAGPFTEFDKNNSYHRVVGRLKDGVTTDSAREELSILRERLQERYPGLPDTWRFACEPLKDTIVGDFRGLLWILLGSVGVLLIISCVNVANLLLAHSTTRHKEFSLRLALGASRWRLFRQLFAENLVLSFAGMVAGVVFAYLILQVLVAHLPLSLPRAHEIKMDTWVLVFSMFLMLAASLGFGIAPALRVVDKNLSQEINRGNRGSVVSGGGKRIRSVLVIIEFSLALTLLLSAGLLLRSYYEMQKERLGYDPRDSYLSRMYLSSVNYPDGTSRVRFVEDAVEQLSSVAGVDAAVFSSRFPAYYRITTKIVLDGTNQSNPDALPRVSYFTITSGYFEALDITLEEGRLFHEFDNSEGLPVAIISRGLADYLFSDDDDPVGESVGIVRNGNTRHRIVGVVETLRDWGPLEETPFQIYVPYAQHPIPNPHLLVRTTRDFGELETDLRHALDRVDSRVPLSFNGITLEDFTNELIASQRYSLFLFTVFAGIALILCALGIYGVVSFSVTQRTQELGIRLALGARDFHIYKVILWENATNLFYGLGTGFVVGAIVTRLLEDLLYNIKTFDAITYISVPALLITISFIACWLPARRATRLNPSKTLREE